MKTGRQNIVLSIIVNIHSIGWKGTGTLYTFRVWRFFSTQEEKSHKFECLSSISFSVHYGTHILLHPYIPSHISPQCSLNNSAKSPEEVRVGRYPWKRHFILSAFCSLLAWGQTDLSLMRGVHTSTLVTVIQKPPQSLSLFLFNYKLPSDPSKKLYLSLMYSNPSEPSKLRSEVEFKWVTCTTWPNF